MYSQDIVNSARRTLRDDFAQSRTHSDPAFVDYIQRAVVFIANADSSASVTTGVIDLVAGSLQSLDERGIRILNIFHNNLGRSVKKLVGSRRYSGQQVVKLLPLSTLNAQIPNWSAAKESAIVANAAFNDDDPVSFITYPPNDGTGKVMATWSYLPTPITEISNTETGNIGLPSRFTNIVLNFTMAMCLMRDGESSINGQRGAGLMQSVAAEMGVKDMADVNDTPPSTTKE